MVTERSRTEKLGRNLKYCRLSDPRQNQEHVKDANVGIPGPPGRSMRTAHPR